jgi:hypothetical protein
MEITLDPSTNSVSIAQAELVVIPVAVERRKEASSARFNV